MDIGRFFRGPRKKPPKEETREPSINQGIFYLYLIIFVQVGFVVGLAVLIMVIGQVIITPLWVFLFGFLMIAGGLLYIYRKAKKQFRKLRETLQNVDLSGRNYEISIMGGVLTMRVEQAVAAPLLEAPKRPALEPPSGEGTTGNSADPPASGPVPRTSEARDLGTG